MGKSTQMRIFVPIVMLICAATPIAPLSADELSGNAWRNRCRGTGYALGLCHGYIEAIAHSILALDALRNHETLCIPAGVTKNQMSLVVMQFLDRTPERLHEMFSILAIEAMRGSFPCPMRGSASPKQ